jgi:hypothetical protein
VLRLPGGLGDRAALAALLGRVLRPTARHPAASDYESLTEWLDRHRAPAVVRREIFAPLARHLGQPEAKASAKLAEGLLRDALTLPHAALTPIVLHEGLDLVAPVLSRLAARGGRLRASAPVVGLVTRDHAAVAVTLADGELVEADAVVADLKPATLRSLLPGQEHAREPYFEGLLRLETAPVHGVGQEALRPRGRTPISGLFYANARVRTGLMVGPESALRAADEALTRLREHAPPLRAGPEPAGGPFIPVVRLRRGEPRP